MTSSPRLSRLVDYAMRNFRPYKRFLLSQLRILGFLFNRLKAHKKQLQLVFDSSTICTANCIFCAYQYDNRAKEVASYELFCETIDQYVSMGGKSLDLTPQTGELFVSRFALCQIEYALSAGIEDLSFYTNATLLHKFDIHKLVRLPINYIGISVTPLDCNLYKSIYRSDSYTRVLKNISTLLSAASRESSDIKFSIEYRGNMDVQCANKLPDYLTHIAPHVTSNVQFSALQEFDSWSGRISSMDLIPGMKIYQVSNSGPRLPCPRLWSLFIQPDGQVSLCGCRTNYNQPSEQSPLYLGNIHKDDLSTIANSPKVNQIRNSFLSGNINTLCRSCAWYGQ